MAGKSNIIKVFIDATADGLEKGLTKANTALDGFRAKVAAADGAGGKLKAGLGSAGDILRNNMGPALLAAGAAVGTFVVNSVKEFTTLALSVGKFSDATGLAAEDASRLVEVAGDIGISAGAVQGAVQKMNKSIADGKATWSDFGVEIIRTKDGLVDSNATFLNAVTTIGAIADPTLRAKAAQEVFGKSYAELAELMEMSAGEISDALADVGEAQVIDEDEIAKAKRFRATMDEVSDTLKAVTLHAGEAFVEVVDFLDSATSEAEELGRSLRGVFDRDAADNWDVVDDFEASEQAAADFDRTLLAEAKTFAEVRAIVIAHGGSLDTANMVALEWKDTTEEGTAATEESKDAIEAATKATLEAYQAEMKRIESIEAAAEAQRKSVGGLDDRNAAEVAMAQTVDDLNAKQDETNEILEDSSRSADEHEAALRDLSGATSDAAGDALHLSEMYAEEAAEGGTAAEKASAQIDYLRLLKAKYPELSDVIDDYIAKLGEIPGVVSTTLEIGTVGYEKKAAGGPVRKGETYLVGEEGQELFTASADGDITPASRTRMLLEKFRTKATTWLAGGASSAGVPDDESDVMANRYEVGDIDLATYRTYLQGKLASYKQYSNAWIVEWRKLNKLAKEEADAAEDAADATRKQADAAARAAEAAGREAERVAREADAARKAAEQAETARIKRAYDAAEAQEELADAVGGADKAWQEMQANAVSDPGNWAGLQAGLNERFAKALLRRADASANANGIADGTVEWARAVRAALLGDKANAPGLAPWIDAILAGIPQLATGGVIKARPGGSLFIGGEAGVDELVTPLDGRHTGGNVTVHVNLPPGLSPRAVAQALRDYARYDQRPAA